LEETIYHRESWLFSSAVKVAHTTIPPIDEGTGIGYQEVIVEKVKELEFHSIQLGSSRLRFGTRHWR
jgi:hypothetical protein